MYSVWMVYMTFVQYITSGRYHFVHKWAGHPNMYVRGLKFRAVMVMKKTL